LGQCSLIFVEGQERIGPQYDRDRELQDIERARSQRGRMSRRQPAGKVPRRSGNGLDAKNAAFHISFQIASSFGSIQPGSLLAEDPKLKRVGGFEHHKGTDEDGAGLERDCSYGPFGI
jgi:hypothetical protein